MNWEKLLKEQGVNIFLGIAGLIGGLFVFFLNQQVRAYEKHNNSK